MSNVEEHVARVGASKDHAHDVANRIAFAVCGEETLTELNVARLAFM